MAKKADSKKGKAAKKARDLVVGVDGARGGWVAVALSGKSVAGAGLYPSLVDVLNAYPDAVAIGVDVPVGYPTPAGPRRADVEARAALAPHGSRVFTTYPKAVYETSPYTRALQRARELTGRGISKQAYALGSRILEADAIADRIFEVHPDLSFTQMLGAPPAPKATWRGIAQRTQALADRGIVVPADVDVGSTGVADVLDAAAAAWTAARRARGKAVAFPGSPEPGEPVIWA